MSFSSNVKNELAALKPEKPCCALSQLCALFAAMGRLTLLGRGRVYVQFTSESLSVCRCAYVLLVQALHLSPQIHYVTHARFGGKRSCVLTLDPQQTPPLLKALGMMDESGALKSTSPRLPVHRLCCMRAFLRGMMLGGGTISSPESGYHLELPCRDEATQSTIARCLQRVGLPIRLSERRENGYFYWKQSDQIVDFLSAVGAHQSVMQIEDLRVRRQVMERLNRAMNCDSANLQKTVDTGTAQADAIRAFRETDAFTALPPSLQQIANARLQNPEATLAQLGAMLDPPIGKSGVNHRLRRLMEAIAESKMG